jgi:hypothetical protein
MVVEWKGQVYQACVFPERFQNNPGIIVATWANPNEQGWHEIVRILDQVTPAYDPEVAGGTGGGISRAGVAVSD